MKKPPNIKIGLVTRYIPDLQLQDVSKAVAIVVGPPAMMRFSVCSLILPPFASYSYPTNSAYAELVGFSR